MEKMDDRGVRKRQRLVEKEGPRDLRQIKRGENRWMVVLRENRIAWGE